MRLAAVDIGSNTVHVLVADVVRNKLVDVAHYVEMPELGARVARTGAIGSKGRIAIRALRKVIAQARKHGYDKLIAAATQAVREASDGEAFARQAGLAIGVPVHVISSQREAELSFLGVASRHAARRREWVMVDLGGASTEVVIARGHDMLRSVALPIGSGVLASTYLSDPPRPDERARMRKAALRELTHAPEGDVDRLVATGGTASNLPFVLAKRNPPSVLTTADLLTCEGRLDAGRAAHLAGKLGLPANRVKVMRAGVEVLLLFLDWYGLAVLQISHEGLRHGMLLAYLERGEDWWR
jgi:exopolyphosphatase/guanosine-5'-triphosphate,3'-diphosphate pyrophosphatase